MHRPDCRRFRSALSTALFAALVTPALWPSRACSEEVPPPLRHDIGAFALYGTTSVLLNGAASMPKRGSTGSESVVEMSLTTIADREDSFVAAPSVVAGGATRLHYVFTNAFDASSGVIIEHAPAPFDGPIVAAADFPRAPSVACGGADVVVDSTSSPLTLAPGRYDTITVQQDQTLRLVAGGRYEICAMRLRIGATVEAHTGTVVLLRDYLTTDGRSRITGEGACGARWIALADKLSPAPGAAGFEFAHRSGAASRARIEGQFFTKGRIWLGQNVDYVGRFWAQSIEGFGAGDFPRTIADCPAPYCGDGVVDPGETCDDGNNREGDCCSAFCEMLSPGTACNDDRFCTKTDTCNASGQCAGSGNPCDAPDGDGDCAESCNEETDACNGFDPDHSPCDDGIYCNGTDLCASGRCAWHAGSPCAGLDGDTNCHEGCNEQSHACDAIDEVGTPCNDGRYCTIGETCDGAGACAGGTSPCPGSDADADCAESCDELSDSCTSPDPEGSACNDGLFCTAIDRCNGRGQCQSWGDPCAEAGAGIDADCREACDEGARACSAPNMDGTPCSDGLACTVGERCIGGTCAPGGLTSCDDFNPCTDEFCAPDGNCLRDYNQVACDDGNACTTGDRCTRGSCTGSGAVDCRDDDLCSTDLCDPADGTCHHSYTPAAGCHAAGSSMTRIEMGYSAVDGQPSGRLTTTWKGARGGDVTVREELGDPSLGDAFSVCFYDETSGLPELAYRFDFDSSTIGDASWKRKGGFFDLLYRLSAAGGTTQGVSAVRLGVDKDGVPKLKLRAGANAGCTDDCRSKYSPPPARHDGRLFAMEPGMTVQWTAATGACWSSRYESAAANTGDNFQARSR